MDPEVMPEGFSPRRRGRKPTYDLSDVLAGLRDHPGRWLKFQLTLSEGRSAKAQLQRMGFDVALELDGDHSVLYVTTKGA